MRIIKNSWNTIYAHNQISNQNESAHKLYFYTHYSEEKQRNDMEIDFLLSNNSKLKYKIIRWKSNPEPGIQQSL